MFEPQQIQIIFALRQTQKGAQISYFSKQFNGLIISGWGHQLSLSLRRCRIVRAFYDNFIHINKPANAKGRLFCLRILDDEWFWSLLDYVFK